MSAKVAIVAGAGGALGHATTATLAAGGLTVVAVDRNERGLGELPGSVRAEVADTTDPAAVTRLIDRIATEIGHPDVLVNTIGAFRPGDALTATPDTLRLMIDVNLGPALWLSQAVAPRMQQQGSGAIVHVAARQGIEPAGGMAAYSASKAALVHLTRILDLELRPTGSGSTRSHRNSSIPPQTGPSSRRRLRTPAVRCAGFVNDGQVASW